METPTTALLRNTIDALAHADAHRLETLAVAADALSYDPGEVHNSIEMGSLLGTLLQLLRTTDENLRLLRGLQHVQVRGLNFEADAASYGGVAWVR